MSKIADTLLSFTNRLFSVGILVPLGRMAVTGEVTLVTSGILVLSATSIVVLLFLARRLEKSP